MVDRVTILAGETHTHLYGPTRTAIAIIIVIRRSVVSYRELNLLRAGLEDHRRVGKELLAPFQQFNPQPEQVFWWRDFLSEFLWIDALVQTHGEPGAVNVFSTFLSAADQFNPHPVEILDGTISAFRLISEGNRQTFLQELAGLLADAVLKPFGSVLKLYPQCPMAWMGIGQAMNPDQSVSMVRDAVVRLLPGKDTHAGFCRALPLHRLLAHRKIMISSDLTDTIEAIKTYPDGDRYRAETFARTTHNMMLMKRAREDPLAFDWSRSFWNSNLSLARCSYD
jgi:hypothetical protein